MRKFNVGEKTAEYKVIRLTKEEKKLFKKNNVSRTFTALSVGNNEGQAAIFPIDDFGEEKARKFAKAFAELLNTEK